MLVAFTPIVVVTYSAREFDTKVGSALQTGVIIKLHTGHTVCCYPYCHIPVCVLTGAVLCGTSTRGYVTTFSVWYVYLYISRYWCCTGILMVYRYSTGTVQYSTTPALVETESLPHTVSGFSLGV